MKSRHPFGREILGLVTFSSFNDSQGSFAFFSPVNNDEPIS
jgi:hypothetical protein